jgi:hypothetical protein
MTDFFPGFDRRRVVTSDINLVKGRQWAAAPVAARLAQARAPLRHRVHRGRPRPARLRRHRETARGPDNAGYSKRALALD